MELSAKRETNQANGPSYHHPFVYPTDLRVGYAAGVASGLNILQPSSTSLSSPGGQIMSPMSPTNLSAGAVPSSGSSSVGSPSHPSMNGYALPRNLLFSDSEVNNFINISTHNVTLMDLIV